MAVIVMVQELDMSLTVKNTTTTRGRESIFSFLNNFCPPNPLIQYMNTISI